ncbi:GTP cyclohydrolase II [Pseudoneobacillus sp. C159]
MIANDVKNILKDKLTIIKQDNKNDLCLVGPVQLPVQLFDETFIFQWYSWLELNGTLSIDEVLDGLNHANLAAMQQSSVLVYGDFEQDDNAFIRMHSICHTGDIFGSKRCDCGYQLRQSMKMVAEHGCGAIFYLADHEGRGIGLFSKSLAYLLQQEGYDTVEANHALGFEDDMRSYEEAIRVLKQIRQKPVTLITNNPKKLEALRKHGLTAEDHISLWGDVSVYNKHYLATKVEKSGHIPINQRMSV